MSPLPYLQPGRVARRRATRGAFLPRVSHLNNTPTPQPAAEPGGIPVSGRLGGSAAALEQLDVEAQRAVRRDAG